MAVEEVIGDIERQFDYRPKWTAILFCAVFFGLCAVVLGAKAANNERGLVLNGIIELGPEGASIFYWVLCGFSVAFVIMAVFLALHRAVLRQRLAFAQTALLVPRSRWSNQERHIEYDDIQAVTTGEISGQHVLYVHHTGGKYTIVASMLPSRAAFEEVRALLNGKLLEPGSPMAKNRR